MKLKVASAIIILLLLTQYLLHSCSQPAKQAGEDAAKQYFFKKTDSLLWQLTLLDSLVQQKKPETQLQTQFAACRFLYKQTEGITEYYFQGLTKRINGPALPDVKPEDGQVWPPHGLQVMEQFLYSNYHDSMAINLSNAIKVLATDLRFIKASMVHNTILPQHAAEIIQHQLIRIATLGISGFDAPLSKLSLPEAGCSLQGVQDFYLAYFGDSSYPPALRQLVEKAQRYIVVNSSFDNFNRLHFITTHLAPLSDALFAYSVKGPQANSLMVKPFSGTLGDLVKGKGFDADYYASYSNAKNNVAKTALGQKLFYDVNLSMSGTLSCAGCHKPGLYFTDGKNKAAGNVHGKALLRNTPSLYYAALQSNQFYDLRSITLEDQADEVMKNTSEFNFTSAGIAKKLFAGENYRALFTKAFNSSDTVSGYQVRNALAAFVRSLSPFSSRFDEYLQGNKSAISAREIQGFNLFMGKAKCGTCHFLPLFNGNIPPWFTKSESEIIGVPAAPVWQNAQIDNDSGRYKINRLPELVFAFKTPSLRNVEKTAPYMHNGVYKTLEEVVKFYQKGGGAGLGINLPNQSLPFDSLSLSNSEVKDIVAFMKSLTDKKGELIPGKN